jgi:hypothetical protein
MASKHPHEVGTERGPVVWSAWEPPLLRLLFPVRAAALDLKREFSWLLVQRDAGQGP